MPTTPIMRAATAAGLALALAGGLTACGGDDGTGNAAAPTPTASPTANGNITLDARYLPGSQDDPIPNHVTVDGTSDSLTAAIIGADRRGQAGFGASPQGQGITVSTNDSGESRAFQNLCIGQLDIVDSSRPISPEEWQQCRADGLNIVQFQVAADGAVLAIKSESDVGTDCLTTDELNQAFARGSTVTSWNQLNPDFDDTPFKAGGPTVSTPVSSFFGRFILGDPEPIDSDFRSSYVREDSESKTLDLVAGSQMDQRVNQRYAKVGPLYRKLVGELRVQKRYYADAHQQRLDAVAEQKKGERTNRPKSQQHQDDQRVADAYDNEGKAITKVHAAQVKVAKVRPRYLATKGAHDHLAATRGTVGIFSEGFYATYEDMLRPFEIELSTDGDDRQNCIFPSAQTILNGQYPLSRQLLLTVSTRSLRRPEVRQFVEYYLQHSSRTAVASGLVPLPPKDIQRQVAWLTKGPLPTFASVDGGPVTLQGDTTETTTVTAPPVATQVQKPAR